MQIGKRKASKRIRKENGTESMRRNGIKRMRPKFKPNAGKKQR
jgi:hypothetical protein